MAPEPAPSRIPLDAPEIPNTDRELISASGRHGPLQVAVIEHLRVRVPAAWLEVEQASWDPWLRRQEGVLGREPHWDAEREEGQLLISWASREPWPVLPATRSRRCRRRPSAPAALGPAARRLAVVALLSAAHPPFPSPQAR